MEKGGEWVWSGTWKVPSTRTMERLQLSNLLLTPGRELYLAHTGRGKAKLRRSERVSR